MTSASTTPCRVALLGAGVVGRGVIRVLDKQRDLLAARMGKRFELRHVACRDPARHQDLAHLVPLTTDAHAAVTDPEVDVVIELIGGTTTAGELIRAALAHGKHVVTANKSLLAADAAGILSLAREHGRCVAFEASCGGGMPIINALQKGLVANRLHAMVGILNGTCNFILTKMTRQKMGYDEALKLAQEAGFAEADPTLDVSGRDAAQKLAILATLAFDAAAAEGDVYCEGIDTLEADDVTTAGELGYVIKLLAIGERTLDEKLSLRVHPTLVPAGNVLADVADSFNAISVFGDALGHALFYARGAGQMPTASAVVADLIGVAMGTTPLAFETLRIFHDSVPRADVLPVEQLQTRYYLRIEARDVPGVMARITDALGRNGISLSAVLQHEVAGADGFVPVVVTTHLAREGSMRQAVREINALPVVRRPAVLLRILDMPAEAAQQ
ncbi:MAG: homoserine dehydrogenase [Phycisphaerae bacterium]